MLNKFLTIKSKLEKKYFNFLKPLGLVVLFVFSLLLFGCTQQPALINVEVNETPDNTASGAVPAPTPTSSVGDAVKPVVNSSTPVKSSTPAVVGAKIEVKVPSQLELKVAFAQQAPFGNWDSLHEEACEEASMIMAEKYFLRQPLSETIMEEEIQKLIKWEDERGYWVDLTAQETVDILTGYFKLSARLSREVTVSQIKYELARGNLIIVPAAGRELKNPNFKQPGPIYHMLVIKGYNSQEFITNDPGTRKGNGWRYPYDQLLNAVHNWNHDLALGGMTEENMNRGEKVMIVVNK